MSTYKEIKSQYKRSMKTFTLHTSKMSKQLK